MSEPMNHTEIFIEALLSRTECYCNPMPALGVCTYCLHKEIRELEVMAEAVVELDGELGLRRVTERMDRIKTRQERK